MKDFISEDDLKTFEGWLRYQAVDPKTPEELKEWRQAFEETKERAESTPKVGLMKLQPVPGEHRYAVAVKDVDNLWLILWVRRSKKGEFFVMVPRGDKDWNPHTSYHLDGTMQMKSYGQKTLPPQERQPLTGAFHGTEHLGMHAGYGPKGVGAICDPTAFTGVVEVPPGVLGPVHGLVAVDLVEPGHEPLELFGVKIVAEKVFCEILPWVVIRVGSSESG